MSMIEPPSTPEAERGVQIYSPVQGDLVIASDHEVDTLFKIVGAKYPRLIADYAGFRSGFRTSLIWLSNGVDRIDRFGRYEFAHWHTACDDWCRRTRRAGLPLAVDDYYPSLFAAAVASGDCLYVLPDSARGVSWNVGLCDPYGGGTKPSLAWREIVKGTRGLLSPVDPPVLPSAPAPVRIDVGGNSYSNYAVGEGRGW
jgi:hypothetical protein